MAFFFVIILITPINLVLTLKLGMFIQSQDSHFYKWESCPVLRSGDDSSSTIVSGGEYRRAAFPNRNTWRRRR